MKNVSFGKIKFNSMLGTATITLVVVSLMLLSDTIIEGNFVGETGIAGINMVLPIYIGVNFLAGMIGMGTVRLIYEARGEFKTERANQFFSQSIILAIACGIVAMIFMLLGRDIFLDIMHASAAVRIEAEAYWKYEQILALLVPINYLLIELVYADGDELLTTIANVTQVFGNILLSIFLCKTLGTEGISLGSLIGTFLATAILGIHFFRKCNTYCFMWHISIRDIKEVLYLSMVDAAVYLCWTILAFVLNIYVVWQFTDKYLPIVSLVLGLFELTLFFDGIGEALGPIEVTYLSEGNSKNAKDMARYSCRIAIIEGLAMTLLLLIFAKYIPGIYNLESPELISMAVRVIRIISPMFPFVAVFYMLTSQYLLVRHVWFACISSLIGHVTLYLLLSCSMGYVFGFTAMWIGMAFASPLAIIIILFIVKIYYPKEYFPWLIEPNNSIYENYSFLLSEQKLMQTRDYIENFLRKNKVKDNLVNKTMLLVEETGMVIMERNADKTVIMEITVAIKENGIELMFRDTGEIFDMTDVDDKVTSITSYVVSRIYSKYEQKKYLLTINYNRNMLFIPLTK